MRLAALLAVLATWSPAPANGPDRVHTKDGEEFSGHVVYDDGERVVLRDASRSREFECAELDDVSSRQRSLRLLLIWARDAPNELDVNKELALSARGAGLAGLERIFWLRALLLAPDDAEAHAALGHERRGRRWQLRHGRGWWTFDERATRARDWKHAWELDTLHFHLRSNLPLGDVLALALDLEQLYVAFFEFCRPALPLLEVPERMAFHVHGDLASFPEVASSRRSYFDADANVAHVNLARGTDRGTLVHEGIHALLHNTRLGVRGTDLPAWLDEGLAEYFRGAVTGKLGRARFAPGRRDPLLFARHAGADDPHDIERVLNLAKGDFMSSGDPDLKYAQAYTLVDYLLEARDGALRPRLFRYLRWCYEGRGSSTHFQSAIDVDLAELQRGWEAHVAAVAAE